MQPGEMTAVHSFDDLCELITEQLEDEGSNWRGYIAAGTVSAFLRRLDRRAVPLRASDPRHATPPISRRTGSTGRQPGVSVIDIHNLHDRAKRFVVGVVVKKLFEAKERAGQRAAARVPGP